MAQSKHRGSPPVHTVPNPSGKGWLNEAGSETISNHRLKEPAKAVGRKEAIERKTEHVIHNKDGRIGEKNSYGNDPNPPKDKK